MGGKRQQDDRKFVCQNRKARHDYEIVSTWEAGMVLLGSEVKSLRNGAASLVDAYAEVAGGECFLVGANISTYANSSYLNHEPRRRRKLLLHAAEIAKLDHRVREKGLTLIPLAIYFKEGRAKLELALARGRKDYDKRERILKRDRDRASARDRAGD